MLLVIAIGLSFMVHTERQSVVNQMNQRAVFVLEMIREGLHNGQIKLGSTNHDTTTDCVFPLTQIAQHYHVSIQLVGEDNQAILDCPQYQFRDNPQQNYIEWVGQVFSVEPLTIEETFSKHLTVSVKMVVSVFPEIDIVVIKQRLFSFLSVMGLLAVLVFSAIKIMTTRLLNELNVVNKALKRVESGHYCTQLPDFYFVELSELSDSYNRAVAQLEKHRRENQTLADRLLWLQEKERRYLAQELHDELGQSISAIKVMCVSMRNSGQTTRQNNHALAAQCQSITAICDHLYTVVRDLMKRLRPTVLDELGLKAALEEIVNSWRQRQTDLDICFSCGDSVEQCSDNIKINLYRIVQESLTNTVKHADSNRIEIRLREFHSRSRPWASSKYLQLDIVDDGKGFNAADKRFGYGLAGMRERVKSMGGTLTIDSQPGAGTAITVQVPMTVELQDNDEQSTDSFIS